MNKLINFFFLLLFPIVLFGQNNWEMIGGKEIQLTAEIYNLAKQSIDTLYLGETPVVVHSWIGKPQNSEHPVIGYQLKSSYYQSTYVDSDSSFQLIEGFLNSTVLEVLEDPEEELLTASLLFKDGYPGKQFKFKNKNNNSLTEIHSYLFHNQLVELIAISRTENWFSFSKDRFFESLTLIDRDKNNTDYGIPIIKKDSYTVSFPGKPEMKNVFTEREEGYVNSKIKILEMDVSIGVVVFISSEAKFPKDFTITDEGLDAFYIESMNGSIQSMNGEFIAKKQVTLDGKKGLEFYASVYEGAARSYIRNFFDKGTMYSVGVLYLGENLTEEGQKFLDSFKIIAK